MVQVLLHVVTDEDGDWDIIETYGIGLLDDMINTGEVRLKELIEDLGVIPVST